MFEKFEKFAISKEEAAKVSGGETLMAICEHRNSLGEVDDVEAAFAHSPSDMQDLISSSYGSGWTCTFA